MARRSPGNGMRSYRRRPGWPRAARARTVMDGCRSDVRVPIETTGLRTLTPTSARRPRAKPRGR